MKKQIFFLVLFNFSLFVCAQNIVKLSFEKSTEVTWEGDEKEYYSDIWQMQVITNVSVPTIQVFRPSKEANNGTAVIVAPGGGLYAHCIKREGNDVAKWLIKKGITTFVLKYRLVPTGEDGVAEITDLVANNPLKLGEEVAKVMPLSIEDGLNAISYVRKNAEEFGIDPKKIGFMGFSAGGAVTMGVAYNYSVENRPNFLVPVYAWTTQIPV